MCPFVSLLFSIFFCLNYLENNQYEPYILASFVLLPLALMFDICDGFVARARQNSSPYGSDLDSLAVRHTATAVDAS